MFHEKFFGLESFLNDLYYIPDPKTVNINHVFQMKKSRHTLVIVKSTVVRKSLKIILISTMPTAVHIGR